MLQALSRRVQVTQGKSNAMNGRKTTYHGDECRAGHVGHLFRRWRLAVGQIWVRTEAVGCGGGVCARAVRRGPGSIAAAASRNGTNVHTRRTIEEDSPKKEVARVRAP